MHECTDAELKNRGHDRRPGEVNARMSKALAMMAVGLAGCASAVVAQVPFEQATRDLSNPDAGTRLRAVRMLKEAAYPEAAVPLAALVTDPEDNVQFEAIWAELNIFLTERVTEKQRVGLVIEKRNRIAAEAAFSAGPLALNGNPVPLEVLTALRTAVRDDNPRVALEALYAFGTLASDSPGGARRELLAASGPELAGMLGVPDPALRLAAARVLGRVFARRQSDAALAENVGDAVITALNDHDRDVRAAAMESLGAMRYERALQALNETFQYYSRAAIGQSALDALAHIGHVSSVPLFSLQLLGKNAALKAIAIEGLARIGDRGGASQIQASLARERNDSVLLAANFAAVLLSPSSIDAIAEALPRPKLREQALQYLIELAPGRPAAFTSLAKDPVARIRADVADVLGLSGAAAALPIVEPMMQDRDPQVVRSAERAVARLRAAGRTEP
jgi:HEAT repeat protein